MTGNRLRYIEIGRGAWGAALLVAPEAVLRAVGAGADHTGVVVARILGARHLVQSAASGPQPSPELLAAGVWVDTVHALTALALAVTDARRTGAGLVDAAIAATLAVAGIHDLNHAASPPPPPSRERILDRIARAVLAVLPGGRPLLQMARPT